MSIETKLQEMSEAFQAFKSANDSRLKSIESKGYAPAEVEEKTNKLNDEITRLEGEIKGLTAAMSRGDRGTEKPGNETEKKHSELMSKYLRKGVESAELKAMSVDSDEDGGFLVSPASSSEIVKQVYESSPVRQYSSVQTISTDALEILEDLDEAGSGWVGETQARAETGTPKLKKIIISVHELYAQPKATQKFLDDAAINVESWLAEKVSAKFARDEASAFVAGNGIMKPKGFLSYDAGTAFEQIEQVETAASGVIAGDDIFELEGALKGEYRKNAVWFAKRQTIKAFRKMKDLQGRYLWEPGLNGKGQAMLAGYELVEANDMPAVAGNALSVAFGDFKAGYQIVDRIGIRVIRDIYTAKPHVLFYTTKRVGGGVKNFEAIKLMKIKA